MNKKLLSLAIVGALSACSQADSGAQAPNPALQKSAQKTVQKATKMKVTHVNANKALELMKARPELVVIDVRTPREFASGHIDGAINIDYNSRSFATEISKLDASQDYLIHCRSGGRSRSALRKFKAKGFSHIIHMDGGMLGWNRAGQRTVQ